MPTNITGDLIENVNTLKKWTDRVDKMKTFDMSGYDVQETSNKYYRFTGFMKKWIEKELEKTEVVTTDWKKATRDLADLPQNWWEKSMALADGKDKENTLPALGEGVTAEQKALVYEKFMPAYRALKERFDKRSVFQFIFNHRQYTAERDTLKALTSLITTLTGDSKQTLDTRYQAHKQQFPSSNIGDYIVNYSNEKAEERRVEEEKRQDQLLKDDPDALVFRDGAVLMREDENKSIIDENKSEIQDAPKLDESLGDVNSAQRAEAVQNRINDIVNGDNFYTNLSIEAYKNLKEKLTKSEILIKMVSKNTFIGVVNAAKKATNLFAGDLADEAEGIENGTIEEDERSNKREIMEKCAKDAFKEAYEGMNFWGFKNIKDRIVAAQEYTDKLLKLASPIGYYEEFAEYGDKYALKDSNFVKEVVSKHCGRDELELVDKSVEDARKELNLNVDERERISIENLKENVDGNQKSEPIKAGEAVQNVINNTK